VPPVTANNAVSRYNLRQIELKNYTFLRSEKVADNQNAGCLRLGISYPWISKQERDFTCLVTQLKEANIEAIYDSFELLPDIRLWERIVPRLLSIGFNGWLYILTHQCFTRKACTDELTAAIDQMLLHMGRNFPMAGLMYDIATQNVPPVLRMRPCISLGDPNWKHQILEVLKHRAPHDNKGDVRKETRFVWKIHPCYCDNPSMTAIEVRPRVESIQYWRFAIPKWAQTTRWGQGPSGGGEISHIRFAEAKGSGRCGNSDVTWFGAANIVSNTESAYAVFSGPLPDFVCFGPANSLFGPPGEMEILWTALLGKINDPADIVFAC
jgi:hypothetical protein